MTVQELINMLQKFDPDKPVEIGCTYDAGLCLAGGSKIEIIDMEDHIELLNDEC